MSKVMQALEHSEQHHQTFKTFDYYTQENTSLSNNRMIPNWLLVTLACAPALVSSSVGIYQSYTERLAEWQVASQPRSQVQQVPFKYQVLPYPSFGQLKETFDFSPLVVIKPVPSTSNTDLNAAPIPLQEEAITETKDSDTLLKGLDLSGLPPEIALRVESALDDSETFNQSDDASDLALNSREWQGKLPPLNFQTHVYSSNPNKRWVKVNGTEYREGDWINDNIQLQNIDSQHSTITFNGTEIQVPALYDWKG
ncbi:general secretion pathway protein GspB [Vibrio sp.]|uniref:general secretion pathway protein GspB n=1 Tax=Vibrio sp. TaxID=678 RepID=UPI00311F3744